MDWRHLAACRRVDPETFFPVSETGEQEAKAVCAGCPVQARCREWALATGQDAGVWGGLTDTERRALKRDQVAAPRRTA